MICRAYLRRSMSISCSVMNRSSIKPLILSIKSRSSRSCNACKAGCSAEKSCGCCDEAQADIKPMPIRKKSILCIMSTHQKPGKPATNHSTNKTLSVWDFNGYRQEPYGEERRSYSSNDIKCPRRNYLQNKTAVFPGWVCSTQPMARVCE